MAGVRQNRSSAVRRPGRPRGVGVPAGTPEVLAGGWHGPVSGVPARTSEGSTRSVLDVPAGTSAAGRDGAVVEQPDHRLRAVHPERDAGPRLALPPPAHPRGRLELRVGAP